MKGRRRPLVAVGLDGADFDLIDRWMRAGVLPNLTRLYQRSACFGLENIDKYRAEIPWTTFLTGVSPERTGYWGRIQYDPQTMNVDEFGAYDFQEYPSFYSLAGDRRVCVFDMPQARVSEKVNGIQVLAWGAHSPRGPSQSEPEGMFASILRRHGPHPTLNNDHANCYDPGAMARLKSDFLTGLERRTAICAELLKDQEWDLFLTMFSETHSSGHTFWHTDFPHPVDGPCTGYLREIYGAVDQSVGHLINNAPNDAVFVVFSVHGMIPNVLDMASMLFLPEFLYRRFLDVEGALLCMDNEGPIPHPRHDYPAHWSKELWNRRRRGARHQLACPDDQAANNESLAWQPANWYKPHWPAMGGFALPSYSDGYIRLNVSGRDAHGRIAPQDYDAVCRDLIEDLNRLRDARSGRSVVRSIVRTRRDPLDPNAKLPDADLIVLWNEIEPYDTVVHPMYGRFGPAPFFRTGGHRTAGFAMISDATPDSAAPQTCYSALDLTPTLLNLVGIDVPDYMEGRVLPISVAR